MNCQARSISCKIQNQKSINARQKLRKHNLRSLGNSYMWQQINQISFMTMSRTQDYPLHVYEKIAIMVPFLKYMHVTQQNDPIYSWMTLFFSTERSFTLFYLPKGSFTLFSLPKISFPKKNFAKKKQFLCEYITHILKTQVFHGNMSC